MRRVSSVVFLDANINLLNISNNNGSIEYLDTLLNNGYMQTVMKASRIQGRTHSLIDHILVNDQQGEVITGTIIDDTSDHFPTFLTIKSCKKHKKPKYQESRCFSPQNVQNFKIALSVLQWESTLQQNDVNTCYENFYQDFMTIFELHFPKTRKMFNKNHHKINDFITSGLLMSRGTKNRLHKIAINDPTSENLLAYKKFRNLFNSLLRKSKQLYFESNLNLHVKNPKKSWDLLKEAIGKKTNSAISEIQINGNLSSDPIAIANEFNSFFSSVGSKISNTVIPTSKNPVSYIPDVPDTSQLYLGQTDSTQIRNILKQMDNKNSPDLDGISLSLLKKVANELCTPLCHIFNLSLTAGVFPDKLKASRVVPIFKSGDNSSCDNYRPISLVSSISKILEKIVASKLTNHLESNNLLYKHQYGFLKGKSTEHNLIHLTNVIGEALNEDKYCIGIFLDLKKAFDVVSHPILLKKLKKLGINGNALKYVYM
jgi:Reverse transcriptase (RNA-dependent DNA polymerase)